MVLSGERVLSQREPERYKRGHGVNDYRTDTGHVHTCVRGGGHTLTTPYFKHRQVAIAGVVVDSRTPRSSVSLRMTHTGPMIPRVLPKDVE